MKRKASEDAREHAEKLPAIQGQLNKRLKLQTRTGDSPETTEDGSSGHFLKVNQSPSSEPHLAILRTTQAKALRAGPIERESSIHSPTDLKRCFAAPEMSNSTGSDSAIERPFIAETSRDRYSNQESISSMIPQPSSSRSTAAVSESILQVLLKPTIPGALPMVGEAAKLPQIHSRLANRNFDLHEVCEPKTKDATVQETGPGNGLEKQEASTRQLQRSSQKLRVQEDNHPNDQLVDLATGLQQNPRKTQCPEKSFEDGSIRDKTDGLDDSTVAEKELRQEEHDKLVSHQALKRKAVGDKADQETIPIKRHQQTKTSTAMAEPTAVFKYTPLDHTTRSIRLVRILPRKCVTDRLQCEMRHTDVDAVYTCLSYEWGPRELRSWGRVLVDGQVLRVGLNLMDFLVHATTRDPAEWYWIDALCINQLDNAEKSHSVQKMGLIYSKASKVLAWLGTDPKIAQFLAKPSSSGSLFYAFWNATYWTRGWVTQELALAPRVILVAGSKALNVTQLPFYDAIQRNEEFGEVDLSKLSALSAARTHSLRSKSLVQLMHMFRFKECTVHRDRVYSLKALCGPGSDIKVDYSLTDHDVADQILRGSHQSLCLCAARTVCNALNITDESHCSLASTLPFAEIDIPHTTLGQLETQEDYFAIPLGQICPAYDGFLDVYVDFEGAILCFGYRDQWGKYSKTTRGSNTCSVKVLPGDKTIVLLSLMVLLDIARLARLRQFGDAVCNRNNASSIRLWKPRLEETASNASEYPEAGDSSVPRTWHLSPLCAKVKRALEQKVLRENGMVEAQRAALESRSDRSGAANERPTDTWMKVVLDNKIQKAHAAVDPRSQESLEDKDALEVEEPQPETSRYECSELPAEAFQSLQTEGPGERKEREAESSNRAPESASVDDATGIKTAGDQEAKLQTPRVSKPTRGKGRNGYN